MRHEDHISDFLRDVVNLNQTRIDKLESTVDTICNFVSECNYEPPIVRFNPQGSWAHRTIIKPPTEKDFDADLLAIVNEVPGWTPKQYIQALFTEFDESDRYEDLASRKTRCVRINYADDFHIDLIPIIEVVGHSGLRYFNCNRRDDVFEETAPERYTNWWHEQNLITGGNQLIKVTRLLKYLRDIKRTFSCKSILLSTLIGYQVRDDDKLTRGQNFPDLPTSLRTILARLDDVLQQHTQMPRVENPVLSSEDYNRHWDQEKYERFRDNIHQYREWVDEAYVEADADDSIIKWRRIFGDDFSKAVVVKSNSRQLAPLFQFAEEWIGRIKSIGRRALRDFPTGWDHIVKPVWPMEERLQVEVRGNVATERNGNLEGGVESGDVVPVSRWLRFQAHSPGGIPETFRVWWRVTNTGGHAARSAGLRGNFYPSHQHAIRWEETKYRGVHWVEAFVVNRRTDRCIGRSAPFFIAIE